MTRAVIALAIVGCAPPADTVGAWTTDDGSAGPTSSTMDEIPLDDSTTSAVDPSTTSSSSSSTSGEPTSTGVSAPPPWIATIGSGATLRAIDLDGGMVVDVCALDGVAEPDGLAFLPDGRLVGSHAASVSLWVADPCDCTVTAITPADPVALHALAERAGDPPTIVGVDALRAGLFEVPVDGAGLSHLADLAEAGAIQAIAAMPDTDDLWALVEADGLHLQRIDAAGAIVLDEPTSISADASGLTIDPDGTQLLACDGDGALWRIDPGDGSSEPLATAWPEACRTLATPHGNIGCIDALFGG
jgi:hypothetical protein